LPEHELEVLVPYDRGDLVDLLHRRSFVLDQAHEADGTRIRARVGAELEPTFAPYVVA
jgi:GTPase